MQPTDLAWACLLIFSRQLNPNTAIRLALRRNNLITISGFVLVQEILDFSRGQCLNTHRTHTHTHTHKYTHTHHIHKVSNSSVGTSGSSSKGYGRTIGRTLPHFHLCLSLLSATSTSHGSLSLSLLSFLPIVTFSLSTVFFFCISFSVIFHPALFSLYILPSHFFLSQISSTSTWQILIQHPLTDRHWCQSPSVPLPHLFHHPFIHLCSLTPSIHPSIQYLFRTHLSASACFFSISFLNPILAHLLHQLLADQAQKPSEGLKQRTRLLTPAKFVANVLDWSGTLKCIQNYQKWTTELDSQHQPRVAAWGWEGWCLLDGQ